MKTWKLLGSLPTLLLIGAAVLAADPPPISVAVMDFSTPYRGRLRNNVGVVGSLVTANLSSNPQFTVVDRAELNKVLKEQALGLGGDISPATAAKIGGLVGAKVLVTGQVFNIDDDVAKSGQPDGQRVVLIVSSVIATETGRTYALREQGELDSLVKMADDLSAKISVTITNQYANFVAAGTVSTTNRLAAIISELPAKPRPVVSIQIDEQFLRSKKPGQTVQTELGAVFQKAGFEVVDANSDKRPDIVITGTASSSILGRGADGLLSASASLSVKAQDRLTGKILVIDLQNSTGVDLNRQMATKKALQDAADSLMERLLPALAKEHP